jgi:predicted GNAT superfamily acetyltransferase
VRQRRAPGGRFDEARQRGRGLGRELDQELRKRARKTQYCSMPFQK